jgi:Fe-S-cluster-containing dehydrogenase component/formate-dependent nitrite reductase membrane component NrfD
VQLGFVIDHARCIGCHACTVACKSENDVPLGSFRTWVKYVEHGAYPDVRRSFAVLRCNQCSAAPCVDICPVGALHKRDDGIVDIDPAACIGCKACMQACPYDALYINGDRGVAEKCHFCAHRVEAGLAPACAVVCPTEAIVPGDFDDEASVVARLRREDSLEARKTEAGTGPNVLYRGAAAAGLDPLRTNAAGGFLWSDRVNGEPAAAHAFAAHDDPVAARTVYDVAHPPPWGRAITGYLFTKSLAAGAFLASVSFLPTRPAGVAPGFTVAVLVAGLIFLALTSVLLVADLKRPERFWYILARPNLDSWLARGTYVLAAYGLALVGWLYFVVQRIALPRAQLFVCLAVTVLLAVLAAGYTGWLFAQAKGRVLWMRRGLTAHLVVQSLVAGGALLTLLVPFFERPETIIHFVAPPTSPGRLVLVLGLLAHLVFTLLEPRLAPARREAEYARAMRLVKAGPYASTNRRIVIVLGIAVPLGLLVLPLAPVAWAAAGVLALVGLWFADDILVRAGQAPAIS